ncbi:MAG: septum formation protein Maf [Kordiimonadaceae bacterium]|nr:septum formation protein Maf [Kordiimonadaceae bacterium]
MKDAPPLILASGSKTRANMLKNAGVCFDVVRPTVDEEALKADMLVGGASARVVADALAETKARTLSFSYPDAFVIGADQVLEKDGRIFSKADTKAEASETLKALSGGQHQLLSAVAVCQNGQTLWRHVESAKITVRPLEESFIAHYLDTLGDDAFWSVGCYQLEGLGAQLFTKVDGDYFTVLGLPLLPLLDFSRRHGLLPL